MNVWSRMSKKERLGMTFALGFLSVAVLDRLIIGPIRGKFTGVDQQIKISEKQLHHDLRNVHLKEQIEKEFERYVEYVERSGSDEEEVAKILREIQSLTEESGVYLVDTKPQPPKTVDFYKEFSVEIETEGRIEAITTFLHQINVSPQLLRVEKLRISNKEEAADTLKSSMLITKVLVL